MSPLDIVRAQIDTIDDAIVFLLRKRFEVVARVAAIKRTHALPAFDAAREHAIMDRYAAESVQVANVMSVIIDTGRKLVEAKLRHDPVDATDKPLDSGPR